MESFAFGPFDSTIDYRLRPGGYVVLTDERGHIAVLRAKSGLYLPGGGQEPDETVERAAAREAFEETGIHVELVDRLGVADEFVFAGGEWGHFRKRCTFFAARAVSGAEHVAVAPSEGVLEWTTPLNALDLLRHGSQRWALLRALESRLGSEVPERLALWHQLGGAIDALDSMILACPETVWCASGEEPWFWYMAYHTAFFLDYALAEDGESFVPPAPFTRDELDPAGILPDRVYSRSEVRAFLALGRGRAKLRTSSPDSDWLARERTMGSMTGTGFEILLYTMRHVQHHTAQLAGLLRKNGIAAPRYVKRAHGDDAADRSLSATL